MDKSFSQILEQFTSEIDNVYEYTGPRNPILYSVMPLNNVKSKIKIENSTFLKTLYFVFIDRSGNPTNPTNATNVRVYPKEDGVHWKNILKDGCSARLFTLSVEYDDDLQIEGHESKDLSKFEDLRNFARFIWDLDFMSNEMKINPRKCDGVMLGTDRYLVATDEIHKMNKRYTIISKSGENFIQRTFSSEQTSEFVVGASSAVFEFDGYYIETDGDFNILSQFLYDNFLKINENTILGGYVISKPLSDAIIMPELSQVRKEIDMKTTTVSNTEYIPEFDYLDIGNVGGSVSY